jgi:hypothetical protein
MERFFVWARRNAQVDLTRWANPKPPRDAPHYKSFIRVINKHCFMVEGHRYMLPKLRDLKIKYPEDIPVVPVKGAEMSSRDLGDEWGKELEKSRLEKSRLGP